MPGGNRVTSCKLSPHKPQMALCSSGAWGLSRCYTSLAAPSPLHPPLSEWAALPAQQRTLPALLHTQGGVGGAAPFWGEHQQLADGENRVCRVCVNC